MTWVLWREPKSVSPPMGIRDPLGIPDSWLRLFASRSQQGGLPVRGSVERGSWCHNSRRLPRRLRGRRRL